MNDLEFKRKKLDTKSSSFCAAKWYNATIWLGSGMTTSCHHPLPHKIDLEEIKKNPSAIHNTRQKKEQRRRRRDGARLDLDRNPFHIQKRADVFEPLDSGCYSDSFIPSRLGTVVIYQYYICSIVMYCSTYFTYLYLLYLLTRLKTVFGTKHVP